MWQWFGAAFGSDWHPCAMGQRAGRPGSRLRAWIHRTWSESLGWVLVVLGIILMPLPGPGMLIVLGGIVLLARHYDWADRIVEPLQTKALEAAEYGVATLPRILVSLLGIACVVAFGFLWFSSPTIPEFSILGVGFGPELPAAGWVGAAGIWSGAAVGLGLLVYSIRRWR